ncbi:MAG: hypothetical protein JSR80_00070 [Verrucomicrobia bacterium]|nr:hypothetical protein [Verrucomicrobiota bacterium]
MKKKPLKKGVILNKLVVFVGAMMSFLMFAPFCHANEAVNRGIEHHVEKLSQKYHLHPLEIDAENLELKFQIHGPLSKSEIRRVLINLHRDCLENMDADAELSELMKNNPLIVSISLFPVDASGKGLYDPNIGRASISQGTLSYWIIEAAEQQSVQPESEESYADALSALDVLQSPESELEKKLWVEPHPDLEETFAEQGSQDLIHLDLMKY